ncbi:MAG: S1 family peptidase [Rothia sp. (in: high G+C Gram-positive bacteria)]|nr:S1 family peptidase [Rothia sp. (in: high G+C Gram-positive bacteria)]
MKHLVKGLTLLGASVALVSSSFSAATAAPDTTLEGASASPYIIGGSQAQSPWAVQLKFRSQGQAGTFACTGEQINSQWVLTAKHCIDGAYGMQVYKSNSQINPGTPISVDRMVAAPQGDIALVRLSQQSPLASYPQLDLNYKPRYGDTGTIMGYGLGANSQPTTTLRSAAVRVDGNSYDAYYGSAVHVSGVTGAANHGDSGGPLLINGKIVAVCSTGDQADPGANINAGSNYALLSQVSSWITSTAGLNSGPVVEPAQDVDSTQELIPAAA